MKYGILGDIHANLSALHRVLDCLGAEGIDQIVSVGDVVGYGAAPTECIDLLRENQAVVVKGNHDAACVGEVDDRFFNNYARSAVGWTRTVLRRQDAEWLAGLPMTATLEHCQVAHGCLANPFAYNYVQSTTDADPSLDLMERPVCFVGHTHVPISLVRSPAMGNHTAYTFEDEIHMGEISLALVNVGSVGQPRDENPRTAYAVYDPEAGLLRIRRVEYDIDREANRIRAAGLPGMLADRLYLGV